MSTDSPRIWRRIAPYALFLGPLALALAAAHRMPPADALALGTTRVDGEALGVRARPDAVEIPEPQSVYGDGFMFVVDVDGPTLVLQVDADPSWAAPGSHRQMGNSSWDARFVADLDGAHGSALGNALQGQWVDLYDTGGKTCRARVARPRMYSRLSGEPELALDDDAIDTHSEALADGRIPAALAAPLFAEGEVFVGAPLLPEGDCAGAIWARDARLEAPILYTRAPAHWRDASKTRQLLNTHPATRAIRRQYEDDIRDTEGEATSWRDVLRSSTVAKWTDGITEIRTVALEGGAEGCGEADPSLWAVYDEYAGRRRLLVAPDLSSALRPLVIVDTNRDGHPEILAGPLVWGDDRERVLVEPMGRPYQVTAAVGIPFFGCPC